MEKVLIELIRELRDELLRYQDAVARFDVGVQSDNEDPSSLIYRVNLVLKGYEIE